LARTGVKVEVARESCNACAGEVNAPVWLLARRWSSAGVPAAVGKLDGSASMRTEIWDSRVKWTHGSARGGSCSDEGHFGGSSFIILRKGVQVRLAVGGVGGRPVQSRARVGL
jgi:hypothetical protein